MAAEKIKVTSKQANTTHGETSSLLVAQVGVSRATLESQHKIFHLVILDAKYM